METINFKPGPNAEELRVSPRGTELVKKLVSYTKKQDGTLWAIADGDTSKAQPLVGNETFDTIRAFMRSVNWIEILGVQDEIMVTHGPKCECGAAYTSNPNLHSPIMPCPLYRKAM